MAADPETGSATIPVEEGKLPQDDVFQKANFGPDSKYFLEAAAFLTIWSLLVINEGAIRFTDLVPEIGLDGGRPSKAALFVAALAEVLFGLMGLLVGLSALVLRWYNTTVVKVTMIVQAVLGLYVFIMYVFLKPIYRAIDITSDKPDPVQAALSISENRALIAMSLLTSFNWCFALQGGQFVFMARLIVGGTGQDFLKQRTGNTMRAMFWNTNLALSGLWTLVTGSVINAQVGDGEIMKPFVSPPNVGRLPGLTIFIGLLVMLWGIAGIAFAAGKIKAPNGYYLGTGVVYLFSFLNYTIVQFGLMKRERVTPAGNVPLGFAGPVAMHAGLVFLVTMIGPYFVHQANKEQFRD